VGGRQREFVWGQTHTLCGDTVTSCVATEKLSGDRDKSCVETEVVWGNGQKFCGETDRSFVGTQSKDL
jgi:hypothetical protein